MTKSCTCLWPPIPYWHGQQASTDIDCPLHGMHPAPLFFFPLGIAPDGVQAKGSGTHVTLTCGCVIVYVGRRRRGLLTQCWEHDGYWPMADAARWQFAMRAHLN